MSGGQPEATEVRIIKKKKGGGGSHGGAWKVAYADFVTAMMALFIVLWILSQSQSIRLAVAQYFKNPGILSGATGVMETSDMGGEMPTPGHSQNLQSLAPVGMDVLTEQARLEEVKKHIQEIIAQLPDFGAVKDQVSLEITDEGLRIELMEKEDSNFFDLGSATLKGETKKIFGLIAQELGKLPNRLSLEGHTDARPYGSQTYTNWELSADRANAVRRFMETAGLRPEQVLTVRGFADRHLLNPANPLDFKNRRVSIIVMFQAKGKMPAVKIPQSLGKVKQPEKKEGAPPGGAAGLQGKMPAEIGKMEDGLGAEVKKLLKSPEPGGAGKGEPQLKTQMRLGW
jgi:chemotaxis protein MotB